MISRHMVKKTGVALLTVLTLSGVASPVIASANSNQQNNTKSSQESQTNENKLNDEINEIFGKQAQYYRDNINNQKKSAVSTQDQIKSFNNEDKSQLKQIEQSGVFSKSQINNIINSKYNRENEITPRWKTALVKFAVKKAIKLSGKKLREETVSECLDYVTDFEGHLRYHLQHFLMHRLHVRRPVAYWAAKTAVFLAF